MRVWLKTLQIVLFSIWVEFDADFESDEKVAKKCTRRKLQGWELLYTVLKVEKVHNLYTFMKTTFFVETFVHFFQRIWNQHQILRFLTPISKRCEKNIFGVLLALFAQNRSKNLKILFKNVNQNKLYFQILVSDQQGVKLVSPYCATIPSTILMILALECATLQECLFHSAH
jgi:hypothetical protein